MREFEEEAGILLGERDLHYLGTTRLQGQERNCSRVIQHSYLVIREIGLEEVSFSEESDGFLHVPLKPLLRLLEGETESVEAAVRYADGPGEPGRTADHRGGVRPLSTGHRRGDCEVAAGRRAVPRRGAGGSAALEMIRQALSQNLHLPVLDADLVGLDRPPRTGEALAAGDVELPAVAAAGNGGAVQAAEPEVAPLVQAGVGDGQETPAGVEDGDRLVPDLHDPGAVLLDLVGPGDRRPRPPPRRAPRGCPGGRGSAAPEWRRRR